MSEPEPAWALDLFSGEGGAGHGYALAGYRPVGVDLRPMPRYPYEFREADALAVLKSLAGDAPPLPWARRWSLAHGSPPCQHASKAVRPDRRAGRPNLVAAVRSGFRRAGIPWVIENVPGSEVASQDTLDGGYGVRLCGCMFGLGVTYRGHRFAVYRPRHFEMSFPVPQPSCRAHDLEVLPVFGHGCPPWFRAKYGWDVPCSVRAEAMGMPWATRDAVSEGIPPAFTAYIARYAPRPAEVPA